MFLFAPPPQPALPLEDDSHMFYPVRHVFVTRESGYQTLNAASIQVVLEKKAETMKTLSTQTASFLLLVAFGPKKKVLAYALGIAFENQALYVSPLKRAEKTIDPADTVFWFTLNNDKALSDRVNRVFGDIKKADEIASLAAGDIVAFAMDFNYTPKSSDTLMLGLNGIGSFSLKIV